MLEFPDIVKELEKATKSAPPPAWGAVHPVAVNRVSAAVALDTLSPPPPAFWSVAVSAEVGTAAVQHCDVRQLGRPILTATPPPGSPLSTW